MQAALLHAVALSLAREGGGERRPVLRGTCIGDRRAQIVASHLVPAHFFVLALWPAGPVNCLQLRDQAAPPLALVAFPRPPEEGEEFVLAAPLLLVKR